MTCLESFPKVNKCCCCVDLTFGVKIIAFIELFVYMLLSIMVISATLLYDPEKDPSKQEKTKTETFSDYGVIAFSLVKVILVIFLTYGVLMLKASCVLIWIIGSAIFLVLQTCGLIFLVVLAINDPHGVLYLAGFTIINAAIYIWWLLTVNTFYVKFFLNADYNLPLHSVYITPATPTQTMGPYQQSYAQV